MIDAAPRSEIPAPATLRDTGAPTLSIVPGRRRPTRPERATTTVTPRLREQVFARDHHRCTVPGCRSARNLDIHHIVPQAQGGKHELWNLTLLRSGHHAALHDGPLMMQGQAPYGIQVHWVYGPPLPVGLDPEARQALIAERIATIFAQMSSDSGSPPGLQGARVPAGTSASAMGTDSDSGIALGSARGEPPS